MSSTITERLNGISTSVAVKPPCRAATVGQTTLSGTQTIDGVSLSVGDRVLVKAQTIAFENGVYIVRSGAWTRAPDFDGSRDIVGGTQVAVNSGTINQNSYWRVDGNGPLTVGVDAITFIPGVFGDSGTLGFTQSGDGAVLRDVQGKLRETVSVTDFGAVLNGSTLDTDAVISALEYLQSRAVAVGGFKLYMPRLFFPAGRCLVDDENTLSQMFLDAVYSGITLFGEGQNQSQFIYSNTNPSQYALDTGKMRFVEIRDMSILLAETGSRFINHHNAGGGGGSFLHFHNVEVSGDDYGIFCDVTGTSLGSETRWDNFNAAVPSGAKLLRVESTNPQSVNHCFNNPTIGGAGTIWSFGAGGNLKVFGGYSSLDDGSVVLEVNPTAGGQVGSSNWDYNFYGWHPEVITGADGDIRLADVTRGAQINYNGCNVGLLRNDNDFRNFRVAQPAQDYVTINFNDSWLGDLLRFQVNGNTHVNFDNSEHPDWSVMFPTTADYARLESSNYFSPVISVRSPRTTGVLAADPFVLERPAGEAANLTIYQPPNVPLKTAIFRAGNEGRVNGLPCGLAMVYATEEFELPLGSTIKDVTLVYNKNNAGSTAARNYKVTNFDGSVEFIAPTGIAAPATSRTILSSRTATPEGLMWPCDTADHCKVLVSGWVDAGVSGSFDDYGFLLVEYW